MPFTDRNTLGGPESENKEITETIVDASGMEDDVVNASLLDFFRSSQIVSKQQTEVQPESQLATESAVLITTRAVKTEQLIRYLIENKAGLQDCKLETFIFIHFIIHTLL